MALLSTLAVLAVGFVIAAIGFGIVERFWPSIRGQRRFRAGWRTDIAWFIFQPTLGKLFSGIIVFVSVMSLGALLMSPIPREELQGLAPRETWVTGLPVVVQLGMVLLLGDFIGYWQHRIFHTAAPLWKFHAVHHSSTNLDWLSSVRVHPINDVAANVVSALPILFLGFSPVAFAAYVPFLTIYAVMLHANVSWSFGPLRQVIASPTYHRWHHTSEERGMNKNFAGLFPWIDQLFGTLYLPKGEQPTEFGVSGEPLPESFFGQMAYPFRRERAEAASAPEATTAA